LGAATPYLSGLFADSVFYLLKIHNQVPYPVLHCHLCQLMPRHLELLLFYEGSLADRSERKTLVLAGVGLLLGALVFGYRPTLALGNPAVIPLLIAFLKRKRILLGLVLRLAGAALPDVIVAALLMAYNQARFGNSFEFRQSYQLTIINHCSLGSLWENLRPTAIMNGIIFNFFESLTIIVWLSHGGVPTFRRQFFVGCLITLISEETSLTATQP